MYRIILASSFILASVSVACSDVRTYGFDDGTLQGWSYVDLANEPFPVDDETSGVWWSLSVDEIKLSGDNPWNLLQGSTVNGIGEEGNPQREPNYRFIPEPWDNRDCLGALECPTGIMKSPTFLLDDSGPISVDIMGGQAAGGRAFDPELDNPPEFPEDHGEFKNQDGWQGFALYDVAADEYVAWGFPSFNNDGKEQDGRDVWETVEIPAEDFADRANDGKDYRLDVFDSLSGGWGWIGFDTVRIPDASFTAIVAGPAGDCDESGALDVGDLSCVSTIADRDAVLGALNALPGDLDGDGNVAFPDFLVLSANFGNETGSYADGNVDLAGGIAFSDFLALSDNFGKTAAAASSVPEPSGILLLTFAMASVFGLRKRRAN